MRARAINWLSFGTGYALIRKYLRMALVKTAPLHLVPGHHSGDRHGSSIKHPIKRKGFTIVEILIVVAIVCILAAIAVPGYITYRHKAKVAMVLAEIRLLEREIAFYQTDTGDLPQDLSDIGCDGWRDAWDRPYQYLKIAGESPNGGIKGKRRRDRNMNPVNSDYDLYSMGSDGRTQSQFTAKFGRDDIVRARDGAYIGPAENYH